MKRAVCRRDVEAPRRDSGGDHDWDRALVALPHEWQAGQTAGLSYWLVALSGRWHCGGTEVRWGQALHVAGLQRPRPARSVRRATGIEAGSTMEVER